MSEVSMFYAFMRASRFSERLSSCPLKDGLPPKSVAPHVTPHKRLQYYFTTEENYSGDSELLTITVLFFTSDGEIVFGENLRTHWSRWTWTRQGDERRAMRRQAIYRNLAFRHGLELADTDPFCVIEDGVTAVKVKYKVSEME